MSENTSSDGTLKPSGLPTLSSVVANQLSDIFAVIHEMDQRGYPTIRLLEMIGQVVRGAEANQPISQLELMRIQNAVSLAKRDANYSCGLMPWLQAAYHVVWIFIWTVVVAYRSDVNQIFHAGLVLHSAIVSAISGGVGSSLISLGALYRNKIYMDLNERFTMWYVLKPVVGAVMGSFIGLMAGVLVTGLGGSGASPAVILLSAFGGMHEAWAMALFQKYTNKVLGDTSPASTTGTSGGYPLGDKAAGLDVSKEQNQSQNQNQSQSQNQSLQLKS